MENVVGIDVSKDRLDVHVLPCGESFAVTNDDVGIKALGAKLLSLKAGVVALEATGGYEMLATATLSDMGLAVIVINPAQVRAYARALGQRAKTDPIDAEVIAAFVMATKPDIRPLPDAQTEALAALLSRRRQIIAMIVAEQQRMRMALAKEAHKSIKRLLAALKRELDSLDADLDDHIRKSPVWRVREALLTSVPGVGRLTARTLLAEMPELGSLDRRQVAALAGLAPWTRQSGKWKGRSFIGGGRAVVRTALFMATLVACRHNPVRAQDFPRSPYRVREIENGRNSCRHAQAAYHSQCNDPRSENMAERLTSKTVALSCQTSPPQGGRSAGGTSTTPPERFEKLERSPRFNLPTCGGDARQGRGG